MRIKNKFLERLTSLIADAEVMFAAHSESLLPWHIESEDYQRWRVKCLNALTQTLGSTALYTIEFEKKVETNFAEHVREAAVILRCLQEDVEQGHLDSFEIQITGEVYETYLEQAQALHKGGLKDAAAMVCGATLEQSIKKISQHNKLAVDITSSFSTISQACREAGVYNHHMWKQLDAWYTLRSEAAHGNFNSYDHRQVGQMIDGVRHFLAMHMT